MPSSVEKPRVLVVVEDDAALFRSIDLQLRRMGWICVWYSYGAIDPNEIIEMAPDAALIDVHLPAGDGLRLVRRLQEKHCEFPIVVMTGDIDAAMNAQAGGEPVANVLAKPFSARALGDYLNTLVGA